MLEVCDLEISSSEEMRLYAKEFGSLLPSRACISFFGDLGAGKTTFIQGLVEGASGLDRSQVCSPTFGFLHIYPGLKTVFHFDLYRLPSEREFILSGFDEYWEMEGICCIEWAERIPSLLPPDCVQIHIRHKTEDTRFISIQKGESR